MLEIPHFKKTGDADPGGTLIMFSEIKGNEQPSWIDWQFF